MRKEKVLIALQGIINDYQEEKWYKKKKLEPKKIFDTEQRFSINLTQGTIAEKEKDLYIILRGSNEKGDWYGKQGNFNFELITKKVKTNIKVAKGMLLAYKDIKSHLFRWIKKHENIYICGHSRGSGIGMIAAENIKFRHPTKNVYGMFFSGPRVGNQKFCDRLENRLEYCGMWFVNGDIVCAVPLLSFGYRQIKNVFGYWTWECVFPPIAGAHYPTTLQKCIEKDQKKEF